MSQTEINDITYVSCYSGGRSKLNHIQRTWTEKKNRKISLNNPVTFNFQVLTNAFSQVFSPLQFANNICLIAFNVFSPILRSRRPGLRRAGSRVSGRLVAIMIFTWEGKEGMTSFVQIGMWITTFKLRVIKIDLLHKSLRKYGWHRSLTCPRASKPSIWLSSWVKKQEVKLSGWFCYKLKQFAWIGGNRKHC